MAEEEYYLTDQPSRLAAGNMLTSARSKVSEVGRKILSLVSLTGDRL
jgi:hypothetical protein